MKYAQNLMIIAVLCSFSIHAEDGKFPFSTHEKTFFPGQEFFLNIKKHFDSLPIDDQISIAQAGTIFFGLAESSRAVTSAMFRDSQSLCKRPYPLLLPFAIVNALYGLQKVQVSEGAGDSFEQKLYVPSQTYQALAGSSMILAIRAMTKPRSLQGGFWSSLALGFYVKAKDIEFQDSLFVRLQQNVIVFVQNLIKNIQ